MEILRPKIRRLAALLVVVVLGSLLPPLATPALAHPGGTDASGGHRCVTDCPRWGLQTGEYHHHGTPPPPALPVAPSAPVAVGGAAAPTGRGVWVAHGDADVHVVGDAPFHGDLQGAPLHAPLVGMASTVTGGGYWLLGRDGGIFSFGDAPFLGSTGGMTLHRPVVSMAADPDGDGYWFVASDGGIFAFGDAGFHGSMGGMPLNQPVVGMASTATGDGYWLVARDGGIFSFGDAPFWGSAGGMVLNQPIVGMAADPDGVGYWFVAADGGIFSFDAAFHGSATGALAPGDAVVGMVPSPAGGYWLITARDGVLPYGSTGGVASSPGVGGDAQLAWLPVAAPDTSPYDRSTWRHWTDDDGDCQDTRDEVLILESTTVVTLTPDGCDVVAGRWVDAFTGLVVTDPSSLDIDHMVPLADAHRSGGARWDRDTKQAYANDLDPSSVLIAVSSSANRSKGDRSPDRWKPPDTGAWCAYATWWVEVKAVWGLTVTPAEHDALGQMLATC